MLLLDLESVNVPKAHAIGEAEKSHAPGSPENCLECLERWSTRQELIQAQVITSSCSNLRPSIASDSLSANDNAQ